MTRGTAIVITEENAPRAIALAEATEDALLVGPPQLRQQFPASVPFDGLDVPDVEVTPPYLADSFAHYRTLRARDLSTIVFPDRGGLAYCSLRAKEVGTAFDETSIVVDCRAPTLRSVEAAAAPFVSKRLLGTIETERLSLRLADGVLCDDDTAEWLDAQRWPFRRVDSPTATEAPRGPSSEPEPQLVSVVVVRHERVEFLPYCLDGLARQTHPRLEVVIADDGSTSAAAQEQLADLEAGTWPWPLRALRLDHGGLAHARNHGWREAAADLVVFVDDDDVPFDDMVATLVRAKTVSGADYVVGGARFFRTSGKPIARTGDVVRISLCDPAELGLLSNQYGGPVNLWSRGLLERLGGYRSSVLEEWHLLARAVLAGARPTTPPDPVYWYRQTPGSMYSSDPQAFRDAGIASIADLFAEALPNGSKLVPLLAAGAYGELERRKRESRSSLAELRQRARALSRRAHEVADEEGPTAVVRRALQLAHRTIERR